MTLHGRPDLAEATFAFAKLDLLLQFPVYPPPTVASTHSFIPTNTLYVIAYNNPISLHLAKPRTGHLVQAGDYAPGR